MENDLRAYAESVVLMSNGKHACGMCERKRGHGDTCAIGLLADYLKATKATKE